MELAIIVITLFWAWCFVDYILHPYLARKVVVVSSRSKPVAGQYGISYSYKVTFQLLDDSHKTFTLEGLSDSSLIKAYSSLRIGCEGILYTRSNRFLGLSKIRDCECESFTAKS